MATRDFAAELAAARAAEDWTAHERIWEERRAADVAADEAALAMALAIDAEAAHWAAFFKVTDADQIEARRDVMRANVAVGFTKPLEPFLQGFTRAVTADSDMVTLSLLIKPDTDLDDRFKAWDTEEQEFIMVNGWLFTVEDDDSTESDALPAENAVPSRFETVTGTAPSYWACYFINGDAGDMSDAEIAQADAFADWLGGSIVSCEDADFCHHHDATQFGVGGADCQTYTALIDRESVQ